MRAAPEDRPALPDSALSTAGSGGSESVGAATPGNETLRRRIPAIAGIVARVAVLSAVVVGVLYHLVGFPGLGELGTKYRIDLDVYRLGGAMFREGPTLYGSMPPTSVGIYLPFTYPPLSAVLFSPLSFVSLQVAGIVLTILSIGALAATIRLTLRSLGFDTRTILLWGTLGVLAVAFALEPVDSTLDYGQINIVLMALVTVDALAKKPWLPRGVLIGLAAAIKLTPAVFVLYFLVRKDFRAAVMTGVGFLVGTGIGFLATWSDSVQYWTTVLFDSSRIGRPAYPPNQSLTGMLARLGLGDDARTVLWLGLGAAATALVVFAMWRAVRAGENALALSLNAVLGLLVSPVSWSHHWVWAVPLIVVLAVLAYRRRSVLWGSVAAVGAVLLWIAPHWALGPGRWSGLDWPLWDQFLASSYVWWALAAAAVAAVTITPSPSEQDTGTGAGQVADTDDDRGNPAGLAGAGV